MNADKALSQVRVSDTRPQTSIQVFRRQSAFHRRQSAFPQILVSLVLGLATLPAQAEVTVKDAWVRGTVAAQTVTGAFMTLTSSEEAKLVAATSPAAKMTHVHATMMMGSVAHMRSVDQVPLPAGKPVELKPGGYHVMLTDLVRPVKAGEVVPITLTIEGKDGKRSQVEVKATVRPVGSR